jgi:hypothetical protein
MAYKVSEEQRAEAQTRLGKPVYVFELFLDDECTESTHCMVTKPSRPAVSVWLAMSDRDIMQALEVVLKDMLVPGMYDPEVFTNDELFMQCLPLVRRLMMIRNGELKKSLNSSTSEPLTT